MANGKQLPVRTPLMERVDRFTRRHPEVVIAAPYNSGGKWRVTEPGREPRAYPTGMQMMDELEKRYPDE
jgi:hypothetical protein